MTRIPRAGLAGLAAVAILLALARPAVASPVEDYADYKPQQYCSPKAKPGTTALARWLVNRGGGYGPISRKSVGRSGAGRSGPRER